MAKFRGLDAPDAATHVLTWGMSSPWVLETRDVATPVDADLHAGADDMAALAGSVLGYPVTLVEHEPGHPVPLYFVIPAEG